VAGDGTRQRQGHAAEHLTGKDKADARNATRQVLLAAVGGRAHRCRLRRAHLLPVPPRALTERYAKAIAQLASDKPLGWAVERRYSFLGR
jgi:hypothetical protein